MKPLIYKGQVYTGKSLANLCGIKYTTLMERLKRGYTVEEAISDDKRVPDSVIEFTLASYPPDWNGLTNEEFYKIYNQWCKRNDFIPETNVHFTRCIKRLVPNLRVVPTRLKPFGEVVYKRVVRVDGY